MNIIREGRENSFISALVCQLKQYRNRSDTIPRQMHMMTHRWTDKHMESKDTLKIRKLEVRNVISRTNSENTSEKCTINHVSSFSCNRLCSSGTGLSDLPCILMHKEQRRISILSSSEIIRGLDPHSSLSICCVS